MKKINVDEGDKYRWRRPVVDEEDNCEETYIER